MARLQRGKIDYLAFEGGGGKGFAYLGALEALRDEQIFQTRGGRLLGLEGVAGTSAGAITAMFLASGLGPEAIREQLKKAKFSSMFDKLDASRRPGVRGLLQVEQGPSISQNPNPYYPGRPEVKQPEPEWTAGEIASLVEVLASLYAPARAMIIGTKGAGAILTLLANLASRVTESPAKELLADLPTTLECLRTGFGFFVGDKFLDYFDGVLRDAADRVLASESGSAPTISQKEQRYMTFARHHAVFQTTLAIMGTNLERMRSVLFSWKTTPKMPVAAAVRISMGLPLLFKPIVLHDDGRTRDLYSVAERKPNPPELGFEDMVGTWVDGGLLNNIPLQVFDDGLAPTRDIPKGAPPQPASARYRTLGLRLDIADDERKPIMTLGDFLAAWPYRLIMGGAGEAHINKSLSTADRTILLNTDKLSTWNFEEPDPDVAKANMDMNRHIVWDYFAGR